MALLPAEGSWAGQPASRVTPPPGKRPDLSTTEACWHTGIQSDGSKLPSASAFLVNVQSLHKVLFVASAGCFLMPNLWGLLWGPNSILNQANRKKKTNETDYLLYLLLFVIAEVQFEFNSNVEQATSQTFCMFSLLSAFGLHLGHISDAIWQMYLYLHYFSLICCIQYLCLHRPWCRNLDCTCWMCHVCIHTQIRSWGTY